MDLLIETCRADQVSPERRALLDAMYQREFGWDRLVYAAPEWYLMGNVGDSPVGRVGMLQRTITVGETSLPVGGITGVVTEPEWRGQGVASRLVRQAVRFLSDELGLQFGLLTCQRRLGPFYEKLGWGPVEGPTVYAQPDGPRTCPGLTMIVECGSAPWPEGPIDMRGLPW